MAEAGNINLPEQQFDVPPEPAGGELTPAQTAEQAPVSETVGKPQETSKQPPKLIPAQPVADTDVPDAAATPVSTAPPTADDQAVAALPAKDGDLIEKQWVERAKSIIAKTADDPHRQKHEVSKMKAAYIQKRFNKVIKTDDAAA